LTYTIRKTDTKIKLQYQLNSGEPTLRVVRNGEQRCHRLNTGTVRV